MKSSELVKEKIMDTAAWLFYHQGYNSTGINQIIDESEIARASLYNHFKSKSELFYAYLQATHQDWFTQLNLYISKIAEPKGQILAMFDFRMKRQQKNKYAGCPFLKASAEVAADDATAFAIIDENKMKLKAMILELLQQTKRKQKTLANEELADTIYLLLEGATVTASFQKKSSMMQSAKAIAEKLLQ